MRNTIAAAVSVAALLGALLVTRAGQAEAAAEKRGQCGCAAPAMVCGDRTAPMCAIACDPGRAAVCDPGECFNNALVKRPPSCVCR
jgi:hypothetical protein